MLWSPYGVESSIVIVILCGMLGSVSFYQVIKLGMF